MARKPATKGKSSRITAPAGSEDRSLVIDLSLLERHIRERAYGIWIEEGRPNGRDLAHWQRAREELQSEVQS